MPAELSKQGVPFGTIIAFAGDVNQIPVGWMLCNGSQVDRRGRLSKLFDAIGTIWGGSGTTIFFLPDLRGMFLRGVSMGTGVDPDAEQRNSPQEGQPNPGNQKDNVGSIQADELRHHSHKFISHAAFGAQGFHGDAQLREAVKETEETGGSETRPVNAYVHYIIKAFDNL